MKSTAFRFKRTAIVLAAALAVACGLVCPSRAFASSDVVAYSGEGATRENYSSVSDAISAGYSGKTIVMAKDWESSDTITIADSKSVTIDMNGHRITSSNSDYAIRLNEHATLTLTSSASTEFSFRGHDFDLDDWTDLKLVSGGLIIDTDDDGAAGIRMDKWSTVKLANVAVAGCGGSGIVTKDNCTIEMSKGASIQSNYADFRGGGIEFGSDCSLTMDNASITSNKSYWWGGGIFASSGLTVDLKNFAKIDKNNGGAGGGIYLNKSKFSITSSDNTGSISENLAWVADSSAFATNSSGGAIHADSYSGENEGLIKGLNFKNNRSGCDAGAIEVDQEYVRIVDCVITGNKAKQAGGGVYVNNDECSIVDCTITDNVCNNYNYVVANYEGGGVFVSYKYDLYLNGVCTIENNLRYADSDDSSGTEVITGSADDLFLSTISGSTGYAYIKGGVEDGSRVGIRTGIEGERLLGKSISTYVAGTYFSDTDGYWISHGSDHDGDLWQRTGATVFNVYVGGKSAGQFASGATVKLQATSFANGDKFWRWSKDKSSGLSPFDSYVQDVYDPSLTITMPQNDVDLAFDTYDLAGSVTLMVDKPVAGGALATTARVYVADGRFEIVPITWTDAGGATVTSAEYGGAYSFSVSAPRSQSNGFGFSEDVTKDSVRICWTGSDEVGLATASASVDSEGKLNVTSAAYETEKLSVASVEAANASINAGASKDDLLAAVPASAGATLSNGDKATLAIDRDAIVWPEGLLDGEDKVADVGTDAKTFVFDLPLAASSAVSDADGHCCELTLTVEPSEEIVAPTISLAGGTYNRYDSATKLGDDLTLAVGVASSAAETTISYKLTEGGKTETGTAGSGVVVLTGRANESVTYELEVWAVRGGLSSEPVKATYVLDDTLNKQVKIACTDTALYTAGETRWSDEKTITANIGASVSVTAPTEDARVFDHWEWTGRPPTEDADLTQETLQIKSFSPEYSGNIMAVYTPVITAVDLGVDVPQAHAALAPNATVGIMVGSEDASKNITDYLAGDGALTWSPAGEAAAHDTCYNASLSLVTSSSASGVKYSVASALKLYINGLEVEGAGWIDSDAQTLNVAFPNTGPYEYASYEGFEDVSLSYEQAWGYQAGQDAGKSESWGLPKQVKVTYKCGDTELLDVSWDTVTGFDKTDLGEQTFTVTGKISFPEYVDNEDAPESVSVSVRVAAAAKLGAPAASPASGTYKEAQKVSLSCDDKDATIYYTLDGTEPTEGSLVYDGDPVEISASASLKARAFCEGAAPSDTATFEYVIEDSKPDPEPKPEPEPSPATYTVTFATGEGSAVKEQSVESGKCASKPDDPTREGYEFSGWYTDEACANAYDFATPVTGDLTLYAKWAVKQDDQGDDPDGSDHGSDGDGADESGDPADDGRPDAPGKTNKRGGALPTTGDAPAVASLVAAAAVPLGVAGAFLHRRR